MSDLFPTYPSRDKAIKAAQEAISPDAVLGQDFALDKQPEPGTKRWRWSWVQLDRPAAKVIAESRLVEAKRLAAKPPSPVYVPPPITHHDDGIYFDMVESEYHSDPALGSGDMKRLASSGPEYWWDSAYNHARRNIDSAARLFGRAVHRVVLEGREAFDREYETFPEDMMVSDKEISEWLIERGITKLPRSKADKVTVAVSLMPDIKIKDAIEARAIERGVTILDQVVYDRVVISGAMISKNPELSTAFQNGYAEVSVFWTGEDGIRRKARFDYLKLRGVGDLKTVGAVKRSFMQSCLRAVAEYRYDIQAAHYMEARREMARLVAAGRVFGDHDGPWLAKCAAYEDFGWQWVFLQSNYAPLTWSKSMSQANGILDVARADLLRAAETYKAFHARFGTDDMWVLAEPTSELDQSELPGWWARP
jgi:hypothetical protein